MGSLTKLDLNKQIVLMRHNVNRAKIQIIHRLTRQIKTLKEKKAAENLKIKNQKKADRLLNEVLVIKSIPKDEVAAFSLSNTKSVNEILSDVESSSRLRALARLSVHKSISPVVQQFRSNYPAWEKEFPKVLIALKKRQKLKPDNQEEEVDEKTKGNKNKKIKNNNSFSDRDENDVTNLSENESYSSENNSSGSENESFGSDLEVSDEETVSLNDSIVYTRGNRFSVSSDDFNIEDQSQGSGVKSTKKKSIPGEFNLNTSFEKHKSKTILRNETENDLDCPQSESTTIIKKHDNVPKPMAVKKNIDPFFIGSDDREYETCNPVVDNSKMKSQKSSPSDFKLENRHLNKSKFNRNYQTESFTTNNKSNFKEMKDKSFSIKLLKNKGQQKVSGRRTSDVKTVASKAAIKLHPSWEAKKKMSTLASFSGKKIVFD